jgi:uncharacterized protein (DUF427 family)
MARNGESVHRISAETVDRRVRIIFNGVTIADSPRPIQLAERGLTPVCYFPRADVRMDLMERTSHKSHCPFKGDAAYWSLTAGGRRVENAAWSYKDPIEESAAIKGCLAFYLDRLGVTYDEGGE